jgi:hypothetical protein
VVWRASSAAPPGIHRVEQGSDTVFALASELPPEESDLRVLSPQVLGERLAGGRQVNYRTTQEQEDVDDLWTWLLVGVVGAMLMELVVLRVFRV